MRATKLNPSVDVKTTKQIRIVLLKHKSRAIIFDPFHLLFWSITDSSLNNSLSDGVYTFENIREVEESSVFKKSYINKFKTLISKGFFTDKPSNPAYHPPFDITQLVLNPSFQCNSNCEYCYSKELKEKRLTIQPLDDLKENTLRVLDYKKTLNSSQPIAVSSFYTGEISLHFSYFLELKKWLEDIQNQYDFPILFFPPSTNFLEPSEDFLNFINSYGYINISLNLHQKNNITKVMRNIQQLNSNVHKNAIIILTDFSTPLFNIYSQFSPYFDTLSIRPARTTKDEEVQLFSHSLTNYFSQFIDDLLDLSKEELLSFLLKLGPTDIFLRSLQRILERRKYYTRCPAARTAFTIDDQGYVYPCSSLIGNKDYLICNLKENNLSNLQNNNFNPPLNFNNLCSKCFLKFYCGGYCLDWKEKTSTFFDQMSLFEECLWNSTIVKHLLFFILQLSNKDCSIFPEFCKKKGIKYKLDYTLDFESFIAFWSSMSDS